MVQAVGRNSAMGAQSSNTQSYSGLGVRTQQTKVPSLVDNSAGCFDMGSLAPPCRCTCWTDEGYPAGSRRTTGIWRSVFFA
jgi:hypothetical protein